MKKLKNSMTYALQIEDQDIPNSELNLWYSQDPVAEISAKCNSFHRTCRKVTSEDDLRKNEWLVAFWGFYAIKFDYEGRPEVYDYHFALCEDNGTWTERPSINSDFKFVSIRKLTEEFSLIGIQPLFLAIGKAE